MLDQEKFMQYRDLYPWLVTDLGKAIQASRMSIDNLEVENPTPAEPNKYMIARVEAERGAYKGWLQEEPIAKDLLISSAAIQAIRKPPGNLFKLEGLIHLPTSFKAMKKVEAIIKQAEAATLPKNKKTSSTTDKREKPTL